LIILLLVGLALAAGGLLWWRSQAPGLGPGWETGGVGQAGAGPAGSSLSGEAAGSAEGRGAPGLDQAILGPDPAGSAASGLAIANVVVHVAGAVARPGVYSLPSGSRMVDAVTAAGGATAAADPNAVNLARLIADGERLYLPTREEVRKWKAGASAGGAGSGSSAWLEPSGGVEGGGLGDGAAGGVAGNGAGRGGPVNLNTATASELDGLPGIGPTLAARIIQYRTQNGPFNASEELLNVSGIGAKKFDELKDLVTVR
jgi:competence protein ComEA